MFLADNGGCAEELSEQIGPWAINSELVGTAQTRDGRTIRYGNTPEALPGGEETYQSCGVAWANVSNTPFRLYKHWVHEGGIGTPFIVHWPAGIDARGELRSQPAQLPDVMATFLDVAGADYPQSYAGHPVQPLEGCSMTPTFVDGPHKRETLYREHEGNKAVRRSQWKLVCKYPGEWELYDMQADRTETHDLAGEQPQLVRELASLHDAWAARCGVVPWGELLAMREAKN